MSSPALPFTCTLVTPIRNERDNIERLWMTILTQTRLPDQWIIVDNGSTDGTHEWLIEHVSSSLLPIKVLSLPKKTIAHMMNTAIAQATHDVIACCHGGTCIPNDWLEHILSPLEENSTIEVVGGIWQPYGETPFERWVAHNMAVQVDVADQTFWLPAARSLAFRKFAWLKVGGFPEWLPMFGEDTLFGIRLHAARCKFALVRNAVVGWRPKSTFRMLFRQYRLYAEADAVMGFMSANLQFFARPWGVILIALLLGALASRIGISLLTLLILIIVDFWHFRQSKALGSIDSYLLWTWFIRIAQQIGFVRGILMRWFGSVSVPDSDQQAISVYKSLVNAEQHQ